MGSCDAITKLFCFVIASLLLCVKGSLCSTITLGNVGILCRYFFSLAAITDVFLLCMSSAFSDRQHYCPVCIIPLKATSDLNSGGIMWRVKDMLHLSLVNKHNMNTH